MKYFVLMPWPDKDIAWQWTKMRGVQFNVEYAAPQPLTKDSAMNMKKFWVIWNIATTMATNPQKHYSRDDADKEATRLANKHPGCTFIVLEVVGGKVATTVTDVVIE